MHISPQFAKTLISPPKTSEVLQWYYQDSESALGLSSTPPEPHYGSNLPTQNWPSKSAVAAAGKQRTVRKALRQLATNLQGILECAYEPRPHATPLISSFGIAAGPVARLMSSDTCPTMADFTRVLLLLHAAHDAFEVVHPSRRRQSRRQNAERWLEKRGL